MTFGSLFSGIGGIDLGLERAGMTCKWQVEIDDYATRVLEKHWPNVRRWGDITTFPPDTECDGQHETTEQGGIAKSKEKRRMQKPKRYSNASRRIQGEWEVDLIAGGFPCQDISYAGMGAGLSGSRSGLFYELIRVVRELGPRYVLLENVSALLTRGLDDVLGTLASIGFDAEWHCIQAANFGAPHIRDRIFIIAHSDCCKIVADTECNGRERKRKDGKPKRQAGLCSGTGCNKKQGLRNTENQWATEPTVGRVANGIPYRVDRLRGLGNAVVPQIAQWIGERIMECENNG